MVPTRTAGRWLPVVAVAGLLLSSVQAADTPTALERAAKLDANPKALTNRAVPIRKAIRVESACGRHTCTPSPDHSYAVDL